MVYNVKYIFSSYQCFRRDCSGNSVDVLDTWSVMVPAIYISSGVHTKNLFFCESNRTGKLNKIKDKTLISIYVYGKSGRKWSTLKNRTKTTSKGKNISTSGWKHVYHFGGWWESREKINVVCLFFLIVSILRLCCSIQSAGSWQSGLLLLDLKHHIHHWIQFSWYCYIFSG